MGRSWIRKCLHLHPGKYFNTFPDDVTVTLFDSFNTYPDGKIVCAANAASVDKVT